MKHWVRGGKSIASVALAVLLCMPAVPFAYAAEGLTDHSLSTEQEATTNGDGGTPTVPDDSGQQDVSDLSSDTSKPDSDSESGQDAGQQGSGATGELVGDGDQDSSSSDAGLSGEASSTPDVADGDSADKAADALEDSTHTTPLKAGTYVLMGSAGKVLDVEGGSGADAANIQMWTPNMTLAQCFELSYDADGLYTIVCVKSGKALDVAWGGTSSGTNVQQYASNASKAQKWIISDNGDATYSVESALVSGKVLDVYGGSTSDGANVQIWDSNGSSAQKFTFLSTTPEVPASDIVEDGVYTLGSVLAGGKTLDVSNASLANGASAQIWSSNGTFAQMFQITRESSGFYSIRALHSGKALDVASGSIMPGAKVQQWDAASANKNQLWSVRDNGDGTYSFVCVANGLVLDVRGAGVGNGTAVQAFTDNGTSAQKWTLSLVTSLLEDGVYRIKSNLGARRVLDVSGGSASSGANVQTWSWNGSPAQRYRIASAGDDGSFTMEALCSGLLLTQNGSNVIQASADAANADNQRWKVVPSTGGLTFVNVASGLALDVAGAGDWNGCNVGVYAPNNTLAQSFIPEKTDVIGDGTYIVRCKADGRVLDVASGSRSDGANVQAWSANGTGAQAWSIRGVGDGWYVVDNARSGKALDVQNFGTTAGTNVQQWASSGNNAQLWRIEYTGNGFYRFVSACGNLCLDVAGGAGRDGANVQVWTACESDCQQFRLEATTYVRRDFEDFIGSFTTYSTNTYNGLFNMQRALNSFDGYVIWPGQTMSFFGVAGPCGQAQGYLPAGVVGGIGYGGGICQASTTLYGAAIRSGLTIVVRRNHSVPSTYVPVGLDAMVDYGSSDFRVRNDYDFPVKIVTSTVGSSLTASVYGIQPDWYDYIDAESWWTGSSTAAAQRVWYRNGQIVAREALPASYYW